MPLLTATDPLAWRPRRVTVAGASGAGKSTVAARIAAELDITYVELDRLFHGPNWTPKASFVADVDAFTAQPGWVTEWQHRSARTLLVQRADLMVWLDLDRFTVLRQLLGRSVRRRHRREVLWNGNVEPPLWTLFTDPEQVAEWVWSNYQRAHDRVVTISHEYPDLIIVRLPDRAAVHQWLTGPLRQSARLPRNATPG